MYIWYEHIICKLTFLTSVGATNPAWNAAAPIPHWYLSPLWKAGGSPPTLKVLFQCGTKAFTMVKVYRFRLFSISTVHIICPYRMCISYVHFVCPCVMPCACVKRIPYVHIRCAYMIVCTYQKWIKRVFWYVLFACTYYMLSFGMLIWDVHSHSTSTKKTWCGRMHIRKMQRCAIGYVVFVCTYYMLYVGCSFQMYIYYAWISYAHLICTYQMSIQYVYMPVKTKKWQKTKKHKNKPSTEQATNSMHKIKQQKKKTVAGQKKTITYTLA